MSSDPPVHLSRKRSSEQLPPNQNQQSWYDSIQFKAQYHHFRTNNYAAIVKSPHSLEIEKVSIPILTITKPIDDPQESPPKGSACWNFPRVKNLRSIFTPTKSLDDILGDPSSSSSTKFLRPPPKHTQRPRSSSTESGTKIIISHPHLIAHSKSATDVQIQHKTFKYQFPLLAQIGTISNSSSENLTFVPSHELPQIQRVDLSMNTSTSTEKNIPSVHFKNRVEPQLVVASVSYLQRPSSPSPCQIAPSGTTPVTSQPTTPSALSPTTTNILVFKDQPHQDEVKHQSTTTTKQGGSKTSRFFTSCCGTRNEQAVFNNEKVLKEAQVQESEAQVAKFNKSTCSKEKRSQDNDKIEIIRDLENRPPPPACPIKGSVSLTNQDQEGGNKEMADLQSPHYVKRTAHMFNSKYVTSTQNGTHSSNSSPSYLNVSRSVSGYTCLSYGSNTEKSHNQNGHVNGHTSRSVLRHHSSFPTSSISPVRNSSPSRRQHSESSPPPLPKSAPPLASPALLIGQSRTTNQNGRSLILEKIQRLYGTQSDIEIPNPTTGGWKRRTPPPQEQQQVERIIPISLENNNERRTMRMTEEESVNGYQRTYSNNECTSTHIPNPNERIVKVTLLNSTKSQAQTQQVEDEFGNVCSSVDETDKKFRKMGDGRISPILPLVQPESPKNQELHHKILLQSEAMAPIDKENEFKTTLIKDGNYFLNESGREKTKIQNLIANAEETLKDCDPMDDDSGKIRAAIGKAKLLINKKFKQFEGLCHTNLDQAKNGVPADEPFPTKNEDLEGFWDMVLIQVNQIYEMFDECDPNSTNHNNEKPSDLKVEPKKVPLKKSITTSKTTPPKQPTAAASARDETRRKLLAEKRKAMKSLAQQENSGGDSGSGLPPESVTKEVEEEVQIFTTDKQN